MVSHGCKEFIACIPQIFVCTILSNFRALIAAGTQIEDEINNGTIKIDDPPRFKKNVGSNFKAIEISNVHKK